MFYADVILPLAVEGMYTYLVPDSLTDRVKPGCLVLVAFAGSRKYTALVVRVHQQRPEGYELRPIEGIVEREIFFSPSHLKFLLWLGSYYMSTLGEVMKAALPVVFRLESHTSVTRTDEEVDFSLLNRHEQALMNFLKPGEYVALKDVEKLLHLPHGIATVRALLERRYIRVKETVGELFRGKREFVVSWNRDFSEKEINGLLDELKRARAQYRLLCYWIGKGQKEMERARLLAESGASAAVLKGLCERQILRVEERPVDRYGGSAGGTVRMLRDLTAGQTAALDGIRSAFLEKECVLLHGVTSSGKTELYIRLIREQLGMGRQVLYMLPEIALTTQIVTRLREVFGEKIGIYHSGMSDQVRAELWKRQCGSEPLQLILGVRSSVFLPFRCLGLVIVDEEHDASYKQKEPAPRYHGRDAAIMLARMCGAKVLLGSATPSFESYQNALQGKYGLVRLDCRYGGVQMPEIVLADLKEYRRKRLMQGSFSPLLIDEMKTVLEQGYQVILFQNRRGYSSYVQCENCGAIPRCRHCDVSLTYFKQRGTLVCRYCGSVVRMSDCCPDCGGHYREKIPGTEKVEEETRILFPEYRTARMDLDVLNSKARFRKVIGDFEQGRVQILIGTQMVAKGLDFGNVKLVGVMDADSMISFPDFRSEERSFCMLLQVSGRSGRRGERGKMIIQAYDTGNRVYRMLLDGDYPAFFSELAAERRLFVYPPYGRIIQVELRHKDVIVLRNAANWLAGRLRTRLGKRVCGPAVPEISRIGGQYRVVLVLKMEPAMSGAAVKSFLREGIAELGEKAAWSSVRVICDVDP